MSPWPVLHVAGRVSRHTTIPRSRLTSSDARSATKSAASWTRTTRTLSTRRFSSPAKSRFWPSPRRLLRIICRIPRYSWPVAELQPRMVPVVLRTEARRAPAGPRENAARDTIRAATPRLIVVRDVRADRAPAPLPCRADRPPSTGRAARRTEAPRAPAGRKENAAPHTASAGIPHSIAAPAVKAGHVLALPRPMAHAGRVTGEQLALGGRRANAARCTAVRMITLRLKEGLILDSLRQYYRPLREGVPERSLQQRTRRSRSWPVSSSS